MHMKKILLPILLLLLFGCQRNKPARANGQKATAPLFKLLDTIETGVTFANFVNDTGIYNFFSMTNMYNGGGVAVGDVNKDGLQDILFTSNQNKSRLYLNLGNFHFKDITDSAGIDTRGGWTTGAVMADVNADGYTDIYVCRGGIEPNNNSRNLLFINKGNLTFQEAASAYGLDDAGLTTTASFFDYDNDGDLDLYTLNYPVFTSDPTNFFFYHTTSADSLISDKLFENVNGKFFDVSAKANLPIEKGSGLGLVITDLNQDGWMDIYVGNDWVQGDYVYINQKNKTFRNEAGKLFTKNTYFSMGCDIADINNDALPDVFTADMAPAGHYRRNVLVNQAPIDYYFLEKKYGHMLQYSRNVLQINSGYGNFIELGEIAGVSRTDWSWSALWGDYDNDGWKDLFIGNGMKRNVGHMDYEKLMYTEGDKPEYKRSKASLIEKMPRYLLSNYVLKNNQGQTFSPAMKEWGVDQLVNTQGAAYADLNNDGHLDLLLNNVDTTALIYQNMAGSNVNHYLRISVIGEKGNTAGLGTKAWLYNKGKMQYAELTNARGFQSSCEPVLHFGLGDNTTIDSVLVVFPSSKYTVLKNVKTDQHLVLEEQKAEGLHFNYQKKAPVKYLLEDKTKNISPPFVHHESDFSDFKRDKLIPRMFSKEGPAIAIGDLNGDGKDDIFAGGAAGQSGAIYLQQNKGTFILKKEIALANNVQSEDVAALIADLNGDGKNDLYVVSGSNEFPENDNRYLDKVYLNTGNGNLQQCFDCLPEMTGSKSCIAHYDYDKDGDLDLFVGGRTVPGSYGKIPRSYLLQNNGGKFTDVTKAIAPSLEFVGMVTTATWTDVDGDKNAELLLTGDWMPPTVFKYRASKLENITAATGLQTHTGWWNSVTTGDFDNDGDVDLACGNWGLNSIWKATEKDPLCLLVNDFDNNGSVDPILCCFLEGKEGTFGGRDFICQAMTKYFNKYNTYESFANTKVEDLFSKQLYEKAQKLYATEMRSCLFINNGKGNFEKQPLPYQCQMAPVNSIVYFDFDNDGKQDLLLAGNTNQNFYDQGDIDALRGVLLKGDNKGNFSTVPFTECGIQLPGFVRHLEVIRSESNPYLLCGNNGDTLQLFSIKK